MAGTAVGRSRPGRRLHLEALEPRLVLDASMLRITELVASNHDGLADADGDNSDWLELYNSGSEAIDLSGMHLTDKADNLTKWTIPDGVTLEGGGYKVIFASSKDEVLAGGELHTNFNLSAGGEYLALVGTDGTTVIDQYSPTFPAQLEDISYGPAMQQSGAPTTILPAGAAAKAIIPASNALGTSWREVGFDDLAWPISGATGLGYENNPGDAINYSSLIATPLPSGTTGAYIRVKFNLASLADIGRLKLRMKYDDGFAAYINGVEVAEANVPETLQWDSAAGGNHDDAASIVYQEFDASAAIRALHVGENVLAIHALNQVSSSDMLIVPELIAQPMALVTPDKLGFFATPTPGYGNGDNVLGYAAEPTYGTPHGYYSTSQSVPITTATPGAIIVYTTNGSTPQVDPNLNVTNGTLYTGPLTVSSTTTIRASAFKAGYEPSFVEASSYIFVNDVINQSPLGQVPPGWAANGVNGQEINYGIDPDIIALYGADAVKNSLLSLPSISITTDLGNLFDPTTGIYVNANNRGITWERPASIELIDPAGAGFEVNAGLRIRGGYSRNDFNPKHAFRFYFRGEYGDSKLDYPLFGDEGADEFDVLDLRTEQNYSWSNSGNVQNTFVREVFGRDTQRDMGDGYTRSRYYQLYVDGVYWGVYMTQERVEEFYSETYYGGDQDDYDIVKSGIADVGGTELSEGNDVAWRQLFDDAQALAANPAANANLYWTMQGLNPDGTRNPDLPVLLDAENLADYMLIIFYTGGYDTGLSRFLGDNVANNWFGIYNRVTADQGFQFFIHDNEHSLGAEDGTVHGTQFIDRTGPFNNGNQNNFDQFNPQYLHQDLLASPEYKQLFIDRVQKFMFNGGALTTDENIARFMERKNEVDPAIIAEAARWGDSKVAVPLNKSTWQNEINWIVNTYFPSRGTTVLNQLRADGLYTTFAAPSFSQFGGTVPNNYPLSISGTGGTIYYTTDGVTDPRAIGGAVNPAAAVKSYSGPLAIFGTTTVKARLRTAGGQWSGLVEATFSAVSLPGDYNGSGLVDQADYTLWKTNFGQTVLAGSGPDGNGNGVVDAADFTVWRDHLGASLPAASGGGALSQSAVADQTTSQAAPEPVAAFAADDETGVGTSLVYLSPDAASRATHSAARYSRRIAAARPAFDNLLLSVARSAPSPAQLATLEHVFDRLSCSAAADDGLLDLLADHTLRPSKLPDRHARALR
jgi:CotH kinase protein/Chitobiase/beta-hexosaminidase C-terminal domain/Lamin Tail Domain/Fn3 associated